MDRRIPSLDGLRAISISMVMVYHLKGDGLLSPLGNLGVRVFFVISGYLITRLLLREEESRGSIDLLAFYKRRARRIFPAFYMYLLCLAALILVGVLPVTWPDMLRAATYTANYFPGEYQSVYLRHIWSLAVEEQFYLLWPGLLFLAGRRRALPVAAAMLVVVPVIRLIYWQYVPGMHDVMDRRFETVADALATGCVLAGLQGWLAKQKRFNAFLRSPGFYVMPLVPYLTYVAIADRPRTFYGAGITLANLSIAICIDRWVRYPQGVGGALLNSKPLRWVGLLSYSIYLWQQPFLNSEAAAFWNRIPLNLCLAALFSLASYFLVERPVQRGRFRMVAPKPVAAAAD